MASSPPSGQAQPKALPPDRRRARRAREEANIARRMARKERPPAPLLATCLAGTLVLLVAYPAALPNLPAFGGRGKGRSGPVSPRQRRRGSPTKPSTTTSKAPRSNAPTAPSGPTERRVASVPDSDQADKHGLVASSRHSEVFDAEPLRFEAETIRQALAQRPLLRRGERASASSSL